MRTPGPAFVSCINGKAVLQTQLHPLCSCPGKLVCHWARAHWTPGSVVPPAVPVVVTLLCHQPWHSMGSTLKQAARWCADDCLLEIQLAVHELILLTCF